MPRCLAGQRPAHANDPLLNLLLPIEILRGSLAIRAPYRSRGAFKCRRSHWKAANLRSPSTLS